MPGFSNGDHYEKSNLHYVVCFPDPVFGMRKYLARQQSIRPAHRAKDVIESQIAASESSISSETTSSLSSEETTVTESLFETSADEEFDVDLTIDNADLIYAEVFAMVYTPEDYVGKTVKMKGQFVFYYDEEKDQYYYACLIKDAMACCAQGLEFIPAGDCVYPDDFPPALTEINVTGTFNTLEDDGETYCALTDAVYYW